MGDGGRRVGCGVEVVVGGRGSAFGVEPGCWGGGGVATSRIVVLAVDGSGCVGSAMHSTGMPCAFVRQSVLVIGGAYLSGKARKGSKHTPVLQVRVFPAHPSHFHAGPG